MVNEKYEHLPGVKVNYEDGNLISSNTQLQGDTNSVLIMGSAVDGPVGKVVSVSEVGGLRAAEKMYGGMLREEKREKVATLGEYKASYNTSQVNSTSFVVALAKSAMTGDPVIKESVIVEQNGVKFTPVDDKSNLTNQTFYVDVMTGALHFSEAYQDLKITYDVLKSRTAKVPHEGNLVRGMYEAYAAGCEDIRLLRIDGKTAKTELTAKDPAQELVEKLGTATGNTAFSENITLPSSGTNEEYRLVKSPSNPLAAITRVVEHKEDGTTTTWTDTDISNVVAYVDDTPGSESIDFYANVFKPGNNIEIGYEYIKRTYTYVDRLEADGTLTKVNTNTYQSPHQFWSQDSAHFPEFAVYVEDSSGTTQQVPQTNLDGTTYHWKFSADPVNDPNNGELPSEDGAITFTDEYDTWANANGYPLLADIVNVYASYWYYADGTPIEGTNATDHNSDGNPDYYVAPGSPQLFELSYNPTGDSFRIYFKSGNDEFDLTETTDSIDGDYTLDFSGDKPKVSIEAGAVPIVGAEIYAEYKTADNAMNVSPKLVIEGKYPGSVYGKVLDPYAKTIEGVAVEVKEDPDDASYKMIVFHKPSSKQLTTNDTTLEYRFKDLAGLQTLGEIANYINNDPRNNIVTVSAPDHAANVDKKGLFTTNGKVYLGQWFNTNSGVWELKEDETEPVNSPDRFPWMGNDGFFNTNNLEDMKRLYEKLGGKYKQVGAQYELVEQGLYHDLENYTVDVIVLLEAYANSVIGKEQLNGYTGQTEIVPDNNANFATQLAQHCAIVTAKNHETIGVIGVEPVKNTDLRTVQEYIDELTTSGINDHYMYNEASETKEEIMDDEGNLIDIGGYINVIFGPEVGMSNDKVGGYVTNGSLVYAGLISTLPIESSTTNKQVQARGLRYELSEAQMDKLSAARYVTFERKNNGIYVKDGVTAAQSNSDYSRLSTVRIAHGTVQYIRRKADPFIGLSNGHAQQDSLATEIQSGLDLLKEKGVLQDFKFSVFTSAREKVLNNAFIDLELVPQFETRKIYTNVSLRSKI